jgi:hypothetical protein
MVGSRRLAVGGDLSIVDTSEFITKLAAIAKALQTAD